MKKKLLFILFTLVVFTIISNCSFYDRYKPSDEWYSSNINSLELHLQFGDGYAWIRKEAIKQSAVDRIKRKGYEGRAPRR